MDEFVTNDLSTVCSLCFSFRGVIYLKAIFIDGHYSLKEVYNTNKMWCFEFSWNIESYYVLRKCIPIDYSDVPEEEIRTYLALEGIYEEV